jgi:hypothetical protein
MNSFRTDFLRKRGKTDKKGLSKKFQEKIPRKTVRRETTTKRTRSKVKTTTIILFMKNNSHFTLFQQ